MDIVENLIMLGDSIINFFKMAVANVAVGAGGVGGLFLLAAGFKWLRKF